MRFLLCRCGGGGGLAEAGGGRKVAAGYRADSGRFRQTIRAPAGPMTVTPKIDPRKDRKPVKTAPRMAALYTIWAIAALGAISVAGSIYIWRDGKARLFRRFEQAVVTGLIVLPLADPHQAVRSPDAQPDTPPVIERAGISRGLAPTRAEHHHAMPMLLTVHDLAGKGRAVLPHQSPRIDRRRHLLRPRRRQFRLSRLGARFAGGRSRHPRR